MGNGAWPDGLQRLPAADERHGGYDLSRYAHTVADLVSCNLVGHEPEKRSQRAGAEKGSGSGKLQNGLDDDAQAASGNGLSGSRKIARAH